MDTFNIDNTKKYENMCEAFGMSDKKYIAILKSMIKFFGSELINGLDFKEKKLQLHMTKTLALEKYLKSEQFKKTNWKLKTVNDFFLLGVLFTNAQKKTEEIFSAFVNERLDLIEHLAKTKSK